MNDFFPFFLLSLISYLLGAIPFSFLVAKAYGKDLYKTGSGNIGAANVYRATKKIEAMILALVGDVGKGSLALFFAQNFSPASFQNPALAQALAAFFVVMGHNWPIFLKFKGGRGLASLAGAILILKWEILLLTLFALALSILITEVIEKKGLKIEGNFKEKILKILISQVLGRVIGLGVSAILVFIFFPDAFKILIGAAILSGIRHIKRTEEFLKKNSKRE